jgi:hypothetical protein
MIERSGEDMDNRLPTWARRSNPLVRRQLGRHWRTLLPEVRFLWQAFLVQAALILLTLPLPFLVQMTLPAITASVLLFPFAIVAYSHVLVGVGTTAVAAMTNEVQNSTLDLVRATPYDLGDILKAKVAASIWRHVEDLGLLLTGAAVLSLPLLMSHYGILWSFDQHPLLTRTAVILGLGVSLIRLILEPFMIGMLGLMMGVGLRARSAGVLALISAGCFYFLFLNLPRLIQMEWPLRFVVEFIVPIAAPLTIIRVAYRLTQRWIMQN